MGVASPSLVSFSLSLLLLFKFSGNITTHWISCSTKAVNICIFSSEFNRYVLKLLLLLGKRAIEAKMSSNNNLLCFSYFVNIYQTKKIIKINKIPNKLCKIIFLKILYTVVTSLRAESCNSLTSSTKNGETAIEEAWSTAVSVKIWIFKSSAKRPTKPWSFVYNWRILFSRTWCPCDRFFLALPWYPSEKNFQKIKEAENLGKKIR